MLDSCYRQHGEAEQYAEAETGDFQQDIVACRWHSLHVPEGQENQDGQAENALATRVAVSSDPEEYDDGENGNDRTQISRAMSTPSESLQPIAQSVTWRP
jgi:hypothetical protein